MTTPSIRILGSATRELSNDVLAITFTKDASGKTADGVQEDLRAAITEAIAVIQPSLKPGEIDVETSGFNVRPKYNKSNKIDGYLGSASLIVKGTDTAGISKLASELKSVVVSSAKNSMSRATREAAEASLTEAAIADFRTKADAIVKGFNFKGWDLGDVTINVSGDRGSQGKVFAMSASLGGAMESAPMSVESGKSELTVNIQGSITPKKTK